MELIDHKLQTDISDIWKFLYSCWVFCSCWTRSPYLQTMLFLPVRINLFSTR